MKDVYGTYNLEWTDIETLEDKLEGLLLFFSKPNTVAWCHGESEDIPANINAILLPAGQAVDTLSHVAIRARNQEAGGDVHQTLSVK